MRTCKKIIIKLGILFISTIWLLSIKSLATNNEKQMADNSKMHTLPVINSSTILEISAKEKVAAFEEVTGWVRIEYNNKMGWTRKSNLEDVSDEVATGEDEVDNSFDLVPYNIDDIQSHSEDNATETIKKAYIAVDFANIRKSPNTTAEIMRTYSISTEINTMGQEGEWYKVKLSNDEIGYVRGDLITFNKSEITSRSSSRTDAITIAPEYTDDKAELGVRIAEYALQFKGYAYVYGGSTPSGFDCSGLVYYVYRQFGYTNINRTADNQWKNGVEINKSDLQKGDLVFFRPTDMRDTIGHIGIYIGNDEFIHASTASVGVITSSLSNSNYIKRWYGARRII